jgi:uncharacterized protein YkwD
MPLKWSDGLALAARDHCKDAGGNGLDGTIGSDMSSSFDRINRYGKAGWYRAESLTFGGPPTSKAIIEHLRTQNVQKTKKIMLNRGWQYTGIATCEHSVHDYMTSIIYARDFQQNYIATETLMKLK